MELPTRGRSSSRRTAARGTKDAQQIENGPTDAMTSEDPVWVAARPSWKREEYKLR